MDGGCWHWQQFDQMTGDGSRYWSCTQSLTLSPWLLHSQGYWLSHQQGGWCQRLTNGKMQVFLYTWLFGFFFKWRCYIINTEYKGLLLHVHSHSSIMYLLPLIIRDFSSYACDQSAKIFTFLHVFFFPYPRVICDAHVWKILLPESKNASWALHFLLTDRRYIMQ